MDRPDLPRKLHRLGPRPLLMHLMHATGNWPDWQRAWTSLSAGLPTPSPADLRSAFPDAALIAGIAAYRRHPWQRTLADPPSVWTEGSSRLLDYGTSGGPPVLVVPSLVNRAHVLDLMEGHSMLRFLGAGGVRPLLLDWGWPGVAERRFTLTDYIAGRLERAMLALGGPVTLVGYCMGGLMAVAAALRRPGLVARVALLATPWDFWSPTAEGPRRLAGCLPALEPLMGMSGALPVDALQALFSLADPGGVGRKYRDFGAQDQHSPRARQFVALEDWLNDGVPLPAPVAREVLGGWYGANSPQAGGWRVAGEVVQPERLAMESFVAVPARDRIVPAESALALAARLPNASVHRPRAGHVGMVAGGSAQTELWAPLLDWLLRPSPAHAVQQCGSLVGRPALVRATDPEGGMTDFDALARQYGVSAEAVRVLADAVRRGGGRMAQFSHKELGGMGQWSAGGMTQVGAMGDTGLRERVAALCAALANSPQPAAEPSPAQDDWWPAGLGRPSATGAQDGVRYACFPEARRVAIEQGGHLTIYDSGEHRIGGVSQSQGGGQELVFASQHGTVRAQDLPVVEK